MAPSFFILAFIAASSVWCSEPHFHFDIRATIFFVWRLEPLFIFHLVFRATFSFRHPDLCFFVRRSEPHIQFGVQSRIFSLAFRAVFSFRHQSYHIFHLAFRAVVHFLFGVQSHIFILTFRSLFFCPAFRATSLFRRSRAASPVTAFRVTIILSWCSEPHLRFGVQSHHPITIGHSLPHFPRLKLRSQRSEPHIYFGIQSRIFSLAFRAAPLIWRSEPYFHFDIRATTFFVWHLESLFIFRLAFKATFSFRHSDPCFLFSVQSHIFILAFKSCIFSFDVQSRICSFNVQSHHPFLFWSSEPPFLPSLAFRVTIPFQFGIQNHPLFSIQRLEPHLQFGVQSHIVALTFRVVSSVWRSKPLFVFSSISRVAFSVLAFRAITASQFRRLEPSILSISVQSHPHRILSFGVHSHHFSV